MERLNLTAQGAHPVPTVLPTRPGHASQDGVGWDRGGLVDFKVSIARDAPVPQANPGNESGAYARVASIAPSSQMLFLRVSGMTKMAIRNMINGSPMGYASAHPRLFVDR
jgi:hypothetical protein